MTTTDSRPPVLSVIRAADRHHWNNEWLDSRQSFPATGNFDLVSNAHGVLLVHNDDRVDPGEGLDAHQHRDAEIITWVLEGALRHRDSTGSTGVLRPGVVQRMTAGRGITHAEGNAAGRRSGEFLRVIQMWVLPDRPDLEPGYAEKDFAAQLASGELVPVVSGRPEHAGTAVPLNNRFAALHVATMPADGQVTLPTAPFGHLYIARGEVTLADGTTLGAGDALRTTDAPPLPVHTADGAEILFWEMHSEPVR